MEPIDYLKQRSDNQATPPIAKEEILRWMKGTDIASLGAVHVIISKSEIEKAIDPPLSFEDHFRFSLIYYERCFLENPDIEWAEGSYVAGYTAASWICSIWNDPQTPNTALEEIKNWLASIYIKGDERVKECLINATLEHIFEVKPIALFFKDWQKDPPLKTAYETAMLWSKHGGKSPISEASQRASQRGRVSKKQANGVGFLRVKFENAAEQTAGDWARSLVLVDFNFGDVGLSDFGLGTSHGCQ